MTENLLVSLNDIEEKEASWLVPQRMPKGQIIILAGDGGSGKTSCWCSLAAAISTGAQISMISTNDFVLRSELMKEVARLSDLCEQLHLKSFTIKFDRDAGADAWANG